MKFCRRGFWNTALITVGVFLVAAIGYFAFTQLRPPVEQPMPTPTPTATPASPTPTANTGTVNWKEYRSDAYNFAIQYPQDWIAKGSWSEHGGFFYVAFGTSATIDTKPLVTLKVYTDQTILDKFIELRFFYLTDGNWKDTTLDNVEAREIVAVGQDAKQFIIIAAVKDSYGYDLASTVFGDNIDVVRKMSSTFKFLVR